VDVRSHFNAAAWDDPFMAPNVVSVAGLFGSCASVDDEQCRYDAFTQDIVAAEVNSYGKCLGNGIACHSLGIAWIRSV
ncbi:hypothetical protein ACCT20_38120, partial [Rhizobium ruizarguesonis]